MTAQHSQSQAIESVGHFVSHEVSFRGPDAKRTCNLPENQRGRVYHLFVNDSIYILTLETTVSTQPNALGVVDSTQRVKVPVSRATKGAFERKPCKVEAWQELEHKAQTGIPLPCPASAEFATFVTGGPWGTHSPLKGQATVDVTLIP